MEDVVLISVLVVDVVAGASPVVEGEVVIRDVVPNIPVVA